MQLQAKFLKVRKEPCSLVGKILTEIVLRKFNVLFLLKNVSNKFTMEVLFVTF